MLFVSLAEIRIAYNQTSQICNSGNNTQPASQAHSALAVLD